MADRAGHQGCHPKQVEPQTTFQLRQEILQTATPHRECLLPAQRFPTHRHPLRQAPQKFPRLRLPRRCRCMLDFMSRDPSTTLADLFTLLFCTDPSSAVRATLRWWSSEERDDGVTHGWQAWLRWRSVDSFFPASLFRG